MKIFIAGGTGLIGSPLCTALVATGHQVMGMGRDRQKLDRLSASGVEPAFCDVYDRHRLVEIMGAFRPSVVVHQLSAMPARIRLRRIAQETAATNRLRSMGTLVLLEAAELSGAGRFIAQSTAALYRPPAESPPADEDEPFYNDPLGGFSAVVDAIRTLEWQVANHPTLQGVCLRYGHIYGPGTAYEPGGFLYEDTRQRRMPLASQALARFSFVHLDDVVRATVSAIESDYCGVLNIVDDRPAVYSEWLPAYARSIGAPAPRRLPMFLVRWITGAYGVHLMDGQRGASNARARRLLGWELTHPSYL